MRAMRGAVDRTSTMFLLAVAGALMASVSVALQTRTLAITRVNVVDVIDGRIVPDATVTISDATMTGVTPDGTTPADAGVVDGRGKFLIPGLWDMHAHTEAAGESWLPDQGPQLYASRRVFFAIADEARR